MSQGQSQPWSPPHVPSLGRAWGRCLMTGLDAGQGQGSNSFCRPPPQALRQGCAAAGLLASLRNHHEEVRGQAPLGQGRTPGRAAGQQLCALASTRGRLSSLSVPGQPSETLQLILPPQHTAPLPALWFQQTKTAVPSGLQRNAGSFTLFDSHRKPMSRIRQASVSPFNRQESEVSPRR